MSSPWKTLGLDGPTDDLRLIKRAYAKKLKITRPDENPDAFMALRQALEMVQAYTHHQQTMEIENTDEAILDKDLNAPSPPTDATEPHPIDITPSTRPEERGVDVAMKAVTRLMGDPFGRTNTARWSAIFNANHLEPIDEAHDFEDAFLYYLLGTFGYIDGDTSKHNQNRNPKPITPAIATHIFNEMGWKSSLTRPLYMQDQLEWLRVDLGVHPPKTHPLPPTYNLPTQVEPTKGTLKWSLLLIFGLYLTYMAYTYILAPG